MKEKVSVGYGNRTVVVEIDTDGKTERQIAEAAAFVAGGYSTPARVGNWVVIKGEAQYSPVDWQ